MQKCENFLLKNYHKCQTILPFLFTHDRHTHKHTHTLISVISSFNFSLPRALPRSSRRFIYKKNIFKKKYITLNLIFKKYIKYIILTNSI